MAEDEPQEETAPTSEKLRWFPLVVPSFGYNTTDGFGFGLGGEIYARPKSQEYGYIWKFTGSLWTTAGFRYQSHWLRFDHQGTRAWWGQFGYRKWTDARYAGIGGADIIPNWNDAERGNGLAWIDHQKTIEA